MEGGRDLQGRGAPAGGDAIRDGLRSSDLARAAQEGNAEAADTLFEHYRRRLYGIAQARMGSARASLEVSDVLQTTLRRAARSLSSLRPACDAVVDAWFLQILDRAILDQHRRAQAQRRGEGRASLSLDESRAGGTLGDTLAQADSGAETRVERDELAARIWQILGPEERRLVAERVLEGSAWDEVARSCGARSGEAARKHFEELRKRLRERLGRDSSPNSLRSD